MITEDFLKMNKDFQRLPNIPGDFRGFPNLAVTRVCVENSNTTDRIRLTRLFAGVFFLPKFDIEVSFNGFISNKLTSVS